MIKKLSITIAGALALSAQNLPNPNYTITPYVGIGSRVDGQAAVDTLLDGAYAVAEDSAGNIYISESNAGVIRRVHADGIIERFAGSGILGNTGSGRPALETDLTNPRALAIDSDGGLLFYEAAYCRIRKVQIDGIVADVAGTGRCGTSSFSGSDRPRTALDTQIADVGGIAVDRDGHVLFTETGKNIVRRVDSDGFVRTIAGTGIAGSSGDGTQATGASLNGPVGITVDRGGDIFLADGNNCRIRRIDPNGYISIGAGSTTCAPAGSGFVGTGKTPLDKVGALAYEASTNSLYIGLPKVYRVVKVDFNNNRTAPFLGDGKLGVGDPTAPLNFPLNDPSGIWPSTRHGVLVAADSSSQVYQAQNGASNRFAGMWPEVQANTPALTVQLRRPGGMWLASNGSMLLTDVGSGMLFRRSDPDLINVVAGIAYPSGYVTGDNGLAVQATLAAPQRVVQKSTGEIYITTANSIRYVGIYGYIHTLRTSINNPTGLTFDSQERLYYSETGKHQVVMFDLSNYKATVIAGTGVAGFGGDGAAATAAQLDSPGDLAFDSAGNLLILDAGNHRIRKVTPDGNIQTIAGNGLPLAYRDITGLNALKTGLGMLQGMAIDSNDNIFISEAVRVDKIAPDGTVTVITGFLGEDDDGNRSYLDRPLAGAGGLAVDRSARLFISVTDEGRVLVAEPSH